MHIEFSGALWYWRGPSPYYFITVPAEESDHLHAISAAVTYGWGMIPVQARIGRSAWPTSLFPKDGGYIVPVKAAIRQKEKLKEGDVVVVGLEVK
jgi:hypothetical protein